MIPADIKEMAKHDPLVAEIVAIGGPFFYADYQLMRTRRAAEVVSSRYRKATWALILFVVIWVLHVALRIFESQSLPFDSPPLATALRSMGVVLWVGPIALAEYNRRKLKRLQARIDAGEFSAD